MPETAATAIRQEAGTPASSFKSHTEVEKAKETAVTNATVISTTVFSCCGPVEPNCDS
jgi:hypothetical protein